jgi:copper(I)-binding protein
MTRCSVSKSSLANSCLGCLAGATLAVLATMPLAPAHACEAHAAYKTELAEAKSAVMAMDAWVPIAPPGLKAHAAYLVLMNHGAEARAVTAVSSPQYKHAMLHLSTMKDGVAMMQHLAQVDIPAGGKVAFEPHGLHIMLMGPKGPQVEGGTVDLTFTLDDGSMLKVDAKVLKRADAPAPMDHGAMGHGHKGM